MYIDYFYGFFLPYSLILKPETTCDYVLWNNYHFFLLKHVNFLFHHGNFQSWAQKVGALGTALPFSTLCAFSCLPDRTPSHFWSMSRRGGKSSSSCTGFGHALCCGHAANSSNTPSPLLFSLSHLLSYIFTPPSLSSLSHASIILHPFQVIGITI